jgi:hypothetical protein
MSSSSASRGIWILIALAMSGCQSANVPIHGEATEESPLAKISGELAAQDDCLVLVTSDAVFLVTWPPGTTWNDVTGTIELDGRQARLGGPVTLGGGEFEAGPIEDVSDWETEPTEACLSIGRVWRASAILDPEA